MKTQNQRISTRLTAQQRETIEEKISAGEFRSLSEFLRTSIEMLLKISKTVAA